MGIDLSIYLMSKGTKADEALLKEKRDKEYKKLSEKKNSKLPNGVLCYLKVAKFKEPQWCRWIDTSFDLGSTRPLTASHSCVLLVPVKTRIFVLTFGGGRHAIDFARVEFDFGLRVAMQKVNPKALRQVVSKTVEVRTREHSTYHHAGGGVGEFAMDLDTEWLRSLSGKVGPKETFSAVAGADSVKLTNYVGDISSLVIMCGQLLSEFRKPIPDAFSFAKHVRPIARKSPKRKDLEVAFRKRLDRLDFSDMEFIVEWATASRATRYILSLGAESVETNEAETDLVWASVSKLANASGKSASDTKVIAEDGSGEIIAQFPLLRAVQVEHPEKDQTYLRLEGEWFVVDAQYIVQVEKKVQRMVSATLGLPPWSLKTYKSEGEYNRFAAKKCGWLLQDRVLVNTGDGTVEPCDLLTKDGHFIHVKRGSDSAAVNHLLGQLGASADLYARATSFKQEVDHRYQSNWPGEVLDSKRPVFVAAIGRQNSTGPSLGKMLVAKVNLLEQARRIRGYDFGFALEVIELVP